MKRWSAVLRALCVAVAMAACNGGAVVDSMAADADDDDDEAALAAKKSLIWMILPDPVGSDTPAFDWLTGGMPDRLLYFGGFDLWRNGLGTYAGMQWSPAHMDKPGFILRLSGSDSYDRFIVGRHLYETLTSRTTLQPGYKFRNSTAELQVLAGVELEGDLLVQDGRLRRLRKNVGARLTADLWWEPTRSLMLQYAFSTTTIGPAGNMRVASGWRVFDRFWLGPELTMTSDQYDQQYRAGAHLTGLRTGEVEWSVAAGYVRDSLRREGAYARIGITVRPARMPFFEN